tara:strand:+ start:214920 stop:215420 length:501 start_codon:yes stop_codon:yes gene_type:complete
MPRVCSTLLPAIILVSLTACTNYDFTVNDQLVYTPQPLFSDFEVTDTALRGCLEQTIMDNRVTAAAQLEALDCSNAGIRDLTGIGAFTGLRYLRLSDNLVRNLVELRAMDDLQTLYLDNNAVVDPVPLYGLRSLQVLDLSGNSTLQCPDSSALQGFDVTLPRHCRA